jgi:tetratricopeptide (TPR) repeat protein
MLEAACLHIQTRDAEPVRAVELSGAAVRIGRAAFCEVRLLEPQLADEVCQLRRRGAAWYLVPVATPSEVSVDGRPVDEPRLLPFGVPIRIGSHTLTLRGSGASPPEWGSAPTARVRTVPAAPEPAPPPARREPPRPIPERVVPVPEPVRAATPSQPPIAEKLSNWESRRARRENRHKTGDEEQRWEARWRALGERLKAGQGAAPANTTPPPRPAGWNAVDVPSTDRPAVRPATPRPAAHDPRARRPAPALPSYPAVRPVASAEIPRTAERPPLTAARISEPPARPQSPVAATLDSTEPFAAALLGPEHPTALDTEAPAAPAAMECGQAGALTIDNETLEPLFPAVETSADELDEDQAELDSAHSLFDDAAGRMPETFNEPASFEAPTSPVAAEPASLHVEPVATRAASTPSTASDRAASAVRGDRDESLANADRHPIAPADREPEVRDWRAFSAQTDAVDPSWGSFAARSRITTAAATGPSPSPKSPEARAAAVGRAEALPTIPSTMGQSAAAPEAEPGSRPQVEQSWPSATDILTAHRIYLSTRAEPKSSANPARATARSVRPVPTTDRPPARWSLPLWLGWLPLTFATIAIGVVGIAVAWIWTLDGRAAGIATQSLMSEEVDPKATLEPESAPGTAWWQTTSGGLSRWGVALTRRKDDDSRVQARAFLESAISASPFDPAARYVLARADQRESGEAPLVASLGLSRDILSLAWSGHKLLRAGKKDAALKAYRTALDLAVAAEPSRLPPPAPVNDDQIQRFDLPGESLAGLVIADMAASTDWSFTDWCDAVPGSSVAMVAAARRMREGARSDSDKALGMILAEENASTPGGFAGAVRLAVRAEAHALRSDWTEAEQLYRAAIERMPIDLIRRSWWFNLADIERRLANDRKRQDAFEAARSTSLNDAITRRTIELQKQSGYSADSTAAPKKGSTKDPAP